MKSKEHNKSKFKLQHWQIIALLLKVYDFLSVALSYSIAIYLRFDFRYSAIPKSYFNTHSRIILFYALFCVVIYAAFRLYRSMWRFASYNELLRCIGAGLASFIPFLVLTMHFCRMPISYYVIGFATQCFCAVAARFAYRFLNLLRSRSSRSGLKNRVLLIGAGSAGQMILRDVINGGSDTEDKIVAIIDDNPNKWGRYIDNIPIVGGRESIFSAVEKYNINKIFFAIPTASAEDKREILNLCSETGCQLRQLPGIYQLISGEVRASQLKEVAIEDLLGRPPIKINMEEVFQFINGKTVLVTGGGGSIGSEICRQVASHHPKQLIIFDIYENNAYDISNELKDKYPHLNLVTLIGSVRDSRRINMVFAQYKPDIVYHAAAHKHVPLMEDSPCESIKNNVLGTYKTAYAAVHNGCQRFVLISTDKAVNPTNIMGASKRLCEMVIQSMDRKIKNHACGELPMLYTHSEKHTEEGIAWNFRNLADNANTEFVAVRFGNVLGSNGSVVPLFQRQIAAGGPVTVTHPDIIRYFMTVKEAVSLVLQAGTYAKGGEIFVLDMGQPVKIDTMARNLIKLSGLKPDIDIKIEYTGLRPGEKLYEEKLMAEEGLSKTENELIHIGKPIAFDENTFLDKLMHLMEVAYANDEESIRCVVSDMVPTYQYKKQTEKIEA